MAIFSFNAEKYFEYGPEIFFLYFTRPAEISSIMEKVGESYSRTFFNLLLE